MGLPNTSFHSTMYSYADKLLDLYFKEVSMRCASCVMTSNQSLSLDGSKYKHVTTSNNSVHKGKQHHFTKYFKTVNDMLRLVTVIFTKERHVLHHLTRVMTKNNQRHSQFGYLVQFL